MRPLPGLHPDRGDDGRRRRHREGAAHVHGLFGRLRHGGGAPDPVRALGAAGPAQLIIAQIPLRDSRSRRRAGHIDGVPQAHGVGETGRVVLRHGEVGDAELHAGGAVVGAGRGEPDPRRLAVGQGRGQWLTGLIEANCAGAVGCCDFDAAYLGADGGGAGCQGDGRVGHRMVEVDLKPLPHSGLQRARHPAGRGVSVDRGGGPGRRRHVGQRGGIGRRTRRGDPSARPLAVGGRGAGAGVVHDAVEGAPRVVGGPHRRRVIVDASVVGLAGQRGVGDGHFGHRQSGALCVLRQDHGAQRVSPHQAATFVDAQQ
ncbi:Uncharacterised protein [Mycobacteroides abscessus subsp. abscessus]|nr:Uncharacterised protein [Mycobacteroides abscessus subsp. abscessus]